MRLIDAIYDDFVAWIIRLQAAVNRWQFCGHRSPLLAAPAQVRIYLADTTTRSSMHLYCSVFRSFNVLQTDR
jgi:hypothetical protein